MHSTVEEHVLLVSRSAAWMADWASYTDGIDHQDPEVARADGYRDAVLPAPTLSVLGVSSQAAAFVAERRLARTWESTRVVVVGDQLHARVVHTDYYIETTFVDDSGTPVAYERFAAPLVELPLLDGNPAFRTGPIDASRQAALAQSLAELVQGPIDWRWGDAPAPVAAAASRYVLPSLVGVRAGVRGPFADDRVRRITCIPHDQLVPGERLAAVLAEAPGGLVVQLQSESRLVATVEVVADPPPRLGASSHRTRQP
ncbi:MAG: hypothetical protein Q8K58_01785 [Acidimicrobiales bacterium]|nr:hypothetical protein [Acidimicrobiales bacterium]